ncbi:MAG: hypothetical protein ACXQTG_00135 [Methanoculleaceae archaeon]
MEYNELIFQCRYIRIQLSSRLFLRHSISAIVWRYYPDIMIPEQPYSKWCYTYILPDGTRMRGDLHGVTGNIDYVVLKKKDMANDG